MSASGEESGAIVHERPLTIVGVWRVVTTGAPYPDHNMTFYSDKTFLIHNPTNVEENLGGIGINDSIGMGVYRHGSAPNSFEGTFLQLNAHQGTHLPAPDLHVSFKIGMGNANEFNGNALAQFGNKEPERATLKGTRLTIDNDILYRIDNA